MAAILVKILSFFAIAPKLGIWGFSGSLISNLVSELQNSKWKIQNGGDVSVNRKCFGNCAATWYMGVFGVADYESGVRIAKFEMAAVLVQILSFYTIAPDRKSTRLSGSLITNLVSELQNSKWRLY